MANQAEPPDELRQEDEEEDETVRARARAIIQELDLSGDALGRLFLAAHVTADSH